MQSQNVSLPKAMTGEKLRPEKSGFPLLAGWEQMDWPRTRGLQAEERLLAAYLQLGTCQSAQASVGGPLDI